MLDPLFVARLRPGSPPACVNAEFIGKRFHDDSRIVCQCREFGFLEEIASLEKRIFLEGIPGLDRGRLNLQIGGQNYRNRKSVQNLPDFNDLAVVVCSYEELQGVFMVPVFSLSFTSKLRQALLHVLDRETER